MNHETKPAPGSNSAKASDLSGKRAVITGGTTGVGKAAALLLASHGCRIFTCGRNADNLEAALQEVRAKGGVIDGVQTDLASTEGILRLFAGVDEFMGGVDIGIFNAGVASKGELADMMHEEWRYVLDVNLGAYIGCCLEAFKRMKGTGGHVVMIGSMSADVFDERASVYVAAKAGIRGFAASLRKEANPMGIKVSLIEPGTISSAMVCETPEQQLQMIEESRMLRSEDVAAAIHFMLTQERWCDVISLQMRPHLQLI